MQTIHQEQFSIEEITCHILEPIPLGKPFYDATMGPFNYYQTAIVSIKDSNGYIGEVEYPVSGIPLLKSSFAPLLLSNASQNYLDLYKNMFWAIRNEGHRGAAGLALGHLDRVFYDISSQKAQKPLYQHLGATRNWVHVYASGGSTGHTDSELIEECLHYQEKGYTTIKIKAGGDFGSHLTEDAKRVKKVREAIGDSIQLAVDTNQIMKVDQALDFIERITDLNIAWLEEPLLACDIDGIAELCSMTAMPISYGESERTSHLFPTMIRAGVKHIQPVIGNMISIDEWSRVGQWATDNDLLLSCGGIPAVNAQFVATQKESAMCEYIMPYLQCMEPYFLVHPEFKDGKAWLPQEPGMSVKFDWDKLKKEGKIKDRFTIKN